MLLIFMAVIFSGGRAYASDTLETWDVGATDVDFYVGFDGLNASGGGSFGDIMLGYGIVERFSAYLGTTITSDEQLRDGATETYLGVFGTIVDTAFFDLDVCLQLASASGAFELAPAVELNVDADPAMKSWGGYTRIHFPVHGRREPSATMAPDVTYHIAFVLGLYRTIRDRHQILIEYALDLHPDAAPEQGGLELGAVSVGYNVQLSDSLELVSQVYADVAPVVGFGVMTGFIASFPAAHSSHAGQ